MLGAKNYEGAFMRLHADLKNEFTSAARSIVAAILQLHYGTKYIPKHVYPMKQLQLSGSDALCSICPFCECAYEPAKPAGKRFFSHAHAFRISADYAPL